VLITTANLLNKGKERKGVFIQRLFIYYVYLKALFCALVEPREAFLFQRLSILIERFNSPHLRVVQFRRRRHGPVFYSPQQDRKKGGAESIFAYAICRIVAACL